jgi:hypothetical protein
MTDKEYKSVSAWTGTHACVVYGASAGRYSLAMAPLTGYWRRIDVAYRDGVTLAFVYTEKPEMADVMNLMLRLQVAAGEDKSVITVTEQDGTVIAVPAMTSRRRRRR